MGVTEFQAIRRQATQTPLILGGDQHKRHDVAEGYADLLLTDAQQVP